MGFAESQDRDGGPSAHRPNPRALLSKLCVPIGLALLSCTAPAATESEPGSGSPKTAKDDENDDIVVGSGTGARPGVDLGDLDLSLPSDFTPAEFGGWKLGDPVTEETAGASDEEGSRTDPCGAVLTGIVRDFATSANTEIGHPDFGAGISQLTLGLVETTLDAERKPVASASHASAFIQSPESFAKWYRDASPYNAPYYLSLYLEPDGERGVFRFQSHDFYPLDGAGFGHEYLDHNYHFTFELHTAFLYQGGEVFSFSGDDDLWVFINGQLAIDLGGVHGEERADVALDEAATDLGLIIGQTYPLDFFQAERWCCGSNFSIETSLTFTDCGVITVVR